MLEKVRIRLLSEDVGATPVVRFIGETRIWGCRCHLGSFERPQVQCLEAAPLIPLSLLAL